MAKLNVHITSSLLFFLILLNVYTTTGSDQKIDSVRAVCAGLTDEKELADSYNRLASLYVNTNSDSSLFYAQKAFDLASKVKYDQGKGEALFQISYCYDQSGEWETAIKNLEQAITIFSELHDTTYLIGCTLNIGLLYSYGTDLVKGLEYIIEAKNLAEDNNNIYGLPEAYTNIAWYYEYLDEYRSAYNYYVKALEISDKKNDLDFICMLNIGLGYINIKLQKLDEALENLHKAQELLPKIQDEHMESEVTLLFATYFLETNQLEEAQTEIQKAEKLIEEQNFERLRPDFYSAKGKLLLKQHKYAEALKNLNVAIDYCNELKKYDVIKDIYTDKTEVYARLGLYEKAYEMLQLENQLNEQLQPNKIAQALGEFEHEELLKEQQAQEQLQEKLETEQNRNVRYRERVQLQITAFSSIMLVIIVIVLSYNGILRKKHSKVLKENYETINKQKLLLENNIRKLAEDEQKLKQLNATKDKFFSIIAHDLKNPFNVLLGISDLIRTNADIKHTKEFEELVEGMFQTAQSAYNLLENLLEWSRTQTHSIQFDPKLFNICDVLSANEIIFKQAASAKQIEISWPDKNSANNIFADYNMINFVVRNLLNNAVKFSHEKGKIEVSTHLQETELICVIQDHGIGMDADTLDKLFKIEYSIQRDGTANEKGTGLGLILCKEFIEKNRGEIWVESKEDEGTVFFFSLPTHDIPV